MKDKSPMKQVQQLNKGEDYVNLLQVENLHFSFYTDQGRLQVLRGVDLSIKRGEIVGILGESGSGKSVSAMNLIRLFNGDEGQVDQGDIFFKGQNLLKKKEKAMTQIRGKEIAFVFQNPTAAFNPYKRIGSQIKGALVRHSVPFHKATIMDALEEVGLEDPYSILQRYPSQLSGGQNQRIMIAMCILLQPDLIIADEPTSGIDAAMKKVVLDILGRLCKKYQMALMMITHDFEAAHYLCDRLIIMYGGLTVEEGATSQLLENARHPYTRALIECTESLGKSDEILYVLEGMALSPNDFSPVCPFSARCPYAKDTCLERIPPMEKEGSGSYRCFYPMKEEGGLKDE